MRSLLLSGTAPRGAFSWATPFGQPGCTGLSGHPLAGSFPAAALCQWASSNRSAAFVSPSGFWEARRRQSHSRGILGLTRQPLACTHGLEHLEDGEGSHVQFQQVHQDLEHVGINGASRRLRQLVQLHLFGAQHLFPPQRQLLQGDLQARGRPRPGSCTRRRHLPTGKRGAWSSRPALPRPAPRGPAAPSTGPDRQGRPAR